MIKDEIENFPSLWRETKNNSSLFMHFMSMKLCKILHTFKIAILVDY